jgi:broad specificity phosphatase PhoE
MIRLIIVRHGRTAWNVSGGPGTRFRGIIDLPLTDNGVAQAVATARHLAGLPLSAVYSSPLQRAVRTAQIIAEPHALTSEPLEGLSSMDYGEWAGQLDIDVERRWPDLYRRWRQDPVSIQIPGGDSIANLRDRAIAAVYAALERHVDGETIAVVTHQVVTKTLICTLAGWPNEAYWRFRQALCNLSRFDYDPLSQQFTLVGLNDTCHLGRALPSAADGSTRIIAIRHGQTAWNAGAEAERFRGRTDLPLDGAGEAQARVLAERLAGEPIGALYVSPLLRTRQTAAPLAAALGLPVQTHEGLLDIDYGRFQGLSHRQAAATYPDLYALWSTSPGQLRFPGGEALVDVRERLLSFLDELPAKHPRQTVAFVGHQIVNKVAACTLLGLDLDQIWRVRQDTCGFNIVQWVNGAWYTLGINDRCHLSDAA